LLGGSNLLGRAEAAMDHPAGFVPVNAANPAPCSYGAVRSAIAVAEMDWPASKLGTPDYLDSPATLSTVQLAPPVGKNACARQGLSGWSATGTPAPAHAWASDDARQNPFWTRTTAPTECAWWTESRACSWRPCRHVAYNVTRQRA